MTRTSTTDPGPQCFECGYALHGLVSHRCPECGLEFDPIEFLPLRRKDLWRSNPWDRAPGVQTFVATFALSLFRPIRLFKKYRGHYDELRSFNYCAICYSIAVAELVTAGAILGVRAAVAAILFAPFMAIGASLFHGAMNLALAPVFVDRRETERNDYWWPFGRYLSGYFVLTNLVTVLLVVLVQRGPIPPRLLMLPYIFVILWWIGALLLASCRLQRRPSFGLVVTLLAIGAGSFVSLVGYWIMIGIVALASSGGSLWID